MTELSLQQIDHRILETVVRILEDWGVAPTQSAAILGWDAPSLCEDRLRSWDAS